MRLGDPHSWPEAEKGGLGGFPGGWRLWRPNRMRRVMCGERCERWCGRQSCREPRRWGSGWEGAGGSQPCPSAAWVRGREGPVYPSVPEQAHGGAAGGRPQLLWQQSPRAGQESRHESEGDGRDGGGGERGGGQAVRGLLALPVVPVAWGEVLGHSRASLGVGLLSCSVLAWTEPVPPCSGSQSRRCSADKTVSLPLPCPCSF